MIELDFYKNKNSRSSGYHKIYARVHKKTPFGIKQLAEHIKQHGSPFTVDVIMGVLSRARICIQELCMDGQPVKLDDLAIFSPAVTAIPANDVDSFDLSIRAKGGDSGNIKSVRIQCRPTGLTLSKNVTRAAEGGGLGYTSLAQRIKSGEVVLSDKKGEYVATDGGGSGWGDEPVVNP